MLHYILAWLISHILSSRSYVADEVRSFSQTYSLLWDSILFILLRKLNSDVRSTAPSLCPKTTAPSEGTSPGHPLCLSSLLCRLCRDSFLLKFEYNSSKNSGFFQHPEGT